MEHGAWGMEHGAWSMGRCGSRLNLTGITLSKKTVTVTGDEPVEEVTDKWRDNNENIKDFPGSTNIL